MTAKKLSWTQGQGGFTETRCGRFYIDPLYHRFTHSPIGYELYEVDPYHAREHCKGKYAHIKNAKAAAVAITAVAA